ncbi:MAG TPA: hypothetical protein VMY77_03145 [Chitinophagaceae bacterium]|nr:hypothetical protein [Chitinophagaceae bacterium]
MDRINKICFFSYNDFLKAKEDAMAKFDLSVMAAKVSEKIKEKQEQYRQNQIQKSRDRFSMLQELRNNDAERRAEKLRQMVSELEKQKGHIQTKPYEFSKPFLFP